MPTIPYVGPEPDDSVADGVQNKLMVETQLTSGVTRSYVDGRVATLIAGKATKSYVDTHDALYADSSYYAAQDALLIPLTQRGVAGGVATLDSLGRIPDAQVPALGAGIFKGPYGITGIAAGTAGSTPVKIAEFALGATGVRFKPLVFMNILFTVVGRARPIVEVKIGDTTQTTYDAQTLVASGYGRAMYDDNSLVVVKPAADTTNVMQDGTQTYYSMTTSYNLSVWAFDSTGTGQLTFASGQIASAAAWLMRVVT